MPPRRELSTEPSRVRSRIRNRAGRINEKILDEMLLLPGYKPLDEFTYEELLKGKPKHPEFGYRYPRPKWLQSHILVELEKRLQTETRRKLSGNAGIAIAAIQKLITSEETDLDGRPIVPASVKLQAAQYVLDQTIGKPRSRVELSAEKEVKEWLADALINEDGTSYHPVINEDGSNVEDEE